MVHRWRRQFRRRNNTGQSKLVGTRLQTLDRLGGLIKFSDDSRLRTRQFAQLGSSDQQEFKKNCWPATASFQRDVFSRFKKYAIAVLQSFAFRFAFHDQGAREWIN